MAIVTQDKQEVKVDIYAPMREPCPRCGIKGYVSVGGIGSEVTAKCGLCDFSWNPTEPDYIFGDPPPEYGCGCVLPGQHCVTCEAAARAVHGGDELPF